MGGGVVDGGEEKKGIWWGRVFEVKKGATVDTAEGG